MSDTEYPSFGTEATGRPEVGPSEMKLSKVTRVYPLVWVQWAAVIIVVGFTRVAVQRYRVPPS